MYKYVYVSKITTTRITSPGQSSNATRINAGMYSDLLTCAKQLQYPLESAVMTTKEVRLQVNA